MRLFFSLLLLVFAGCAVAPRDDRVTFSKPGDGETGKFTRDALVGTWYGNQPTQEGTTKEWITQRDIDGTFRIRFRESQAGRVLSESTEVGEWGLSYDIEIVITRGWIDAGIFRPAPPTAYFWDLYQILQLDRDSLSYQNHGTGHRYRVRRVQDNFEFPALGASAKSSMTRT